MFDTALYHRERALKEINLRAFVLEYQEYSLCTIHRQENTDQIERIKSILSALQSIAKDLIVVPPLHPRTKAKIVQYNFENLLKGLCLLDPSPYLEIQRPQMSAKVILIDSGGMQKEAYFHCVPCITSYDETVCLKTLEAGWDRILRINRLSILKFSLRCLQTQSAT
jgi:UDP-GlcNAc3NAcA epimerase